MEYIIPAVGIAYFSTSALIAWGALRMSIDAKGRLDPLVAVIAVALFFAWPVFFLVRKFAT